MCVCVCGGSEHPSQWASKDPDQGDFYHLLEHDSIIKLHVLQIHKEIDCQSGLDPFLPSLIGSGIF